MEAANRPTSRQKQRSSRKTLLQTPKAATSNHGVSTEISILMSMQKREARQAETRRDPATGRPPESAQSEETTATTQAAPINSGGSAMPLRRWKQIQKLTEPQSLNSLPFALAGRTKSGWPSEVMTQSVAYIGSLFIPRKVGDRSLKFHINTACTHYLLLRAVYDIPSQQLQQMVQ